MLDDELHPELADEAEPIDAGRLAPATEGQQAIAHVEAELGQDLVDGDALERLDIVDGGVGPIWPGARVVGSALPILTVAGDNQAVIDALEHIRAGDVLVVNAGGYAGRAILGDNLAQRFDLFGATGAIVDGYLRDRDIIADLGFPVFARGLTPAGPFKNGPGRIGVPVAIGGVVVSPGDIVVADSDGIIVIPPHRAQEALASADAIVALEAEKDAEVVRIRTTRDVVR